MLRANAKCRLVLRNQFVGRPRSNLHKATTKLDRVINNGNNQANRVTAHLAPRARARAHAIVSLSACSKGIFRATEDHRIHKRYRPVDNGQRNKVAGAVVLLLIVQYDAVVRVRFELDLDAEFVISFQPVHPDVAFAVKGGHLVIPFVDLLVAQQPGVIWAAHADESRAGQVDARGGHVTRIREARTKFLRWRHRHVIGFDRKFIFF